ncbi:hypothetical protein [Roseicyclus persicicus]|uniref:Uncharacterized protein n=1 Tax=Roseicyclus persicicus TaxID=2650661 RepID=A0A7X6JYW0_9RHOB|nr:hypothetical protein [Roseibacterium persicicum]NKX44173.1 hypothetical protein [Roseibacterium persicicum]
MLGQIADIASLLAALGVFASVAVLAYELRQTRHQAELSNWRDVLQTLTDYKARTQDPQLAGILVRGHADYGSLGPADAITFGMYLEQGVHIYGNFLKHNDALSVKLVGLEGAIANHFHEMLTTPGGAAWWAEAQARKRFMPGTYEVTNALLARRAAAGGAPVTV